MAVLKFLLPSLHVQISGLCFPDQRIRNDTGMKTCMQYFKEAKEFQPFSNHIGTFPAFSQNVTNFLHF